jgi:hypothetical protein
MSFAKCEIGNCIVIMLKSFVHQDIRYDKFDTHFECHMTRRISSREKEEQRMGLLHLMLICP